MYKILLPCLLTLFACAKNKDQTPLLTFYIGTYTQHEGHVEGKGDGIYKMTLNPYTQGMMITDTIKGMTNPSYLGLSKDQNVLYAVNEISPGTEAIGQFEAYDLRPESFGKRLAGAGTQSYAPCQIALNKKGNLAIVSNYAAGIASVFSLPLTDETTPQILR